jgi:mannose-6-phosphate isomerase-like protein (cupin superfamily)
MLSPVRQGAARYVRAPPRNSTPEVSSTNIEENCAHLFLPVHRCSRQSAAMITCRGMEPKRHFTFEDLVFNKEIAHGGRDFIFTKRVLTSSDLGANFVDLTIVPPESDIGVHTHEHTNQEIYVIISGQGMMRVEDSEFPVGPGHVIVNRPGGTHALRNTGETDLKLVVVEVPEPPLSEP